jgi:hypothetical protein
MQATSSNAAASTRRQQQQTREPQQAPTAAAEASVESSFVITMEVFEPPIYGKPIGKSSTMDNARKFMQHVSARMMLGHDPNFEENTDRLFYDEILDDREPDTQYLRWMDPEEIEALNPLNAPSGSECLEGLLHVHDSNVTWEGHRKIRRRYTIHRVDSVIWDVMEATSVAETFADRQRVPSLAEQYSYDGTRTQQQQQAASTSGNDFSNAVSSASSSSAANTTTNPKYFV